MTANTGIIDARGAPFQSCWGCGKTAGGHEAHYYYGNYPLGVAHSECGARISAILDRSIRALGSMDDKGLVHETAIQGLITTSARKLDYHNLNEIDDATIRKVVENEGVQAALRITRALSVIDDNTWFARFTEKFKTIMNGPEKIKKEATAEDKRVLQEMYARLDSHLEHLEKGNRILRASMDSIVEQVDRFMKQEVKELPYCVIKGAFEDILTSCGRETLKKVLNEIETEKLKVFFIAKKVGVDFFEVEEIVLLPLGKIKISGAGFESLAEANLLPLKSLDWKGCVFEYKKSILTFSWEGSEPKG